MVSCVARSVLIVVLLLGLFASQVNNVPVVRDMEKNAFAPSDMMVGVATAQCACLLSRSLSSHPPAACAALQLYDQDTKLLLLNPNKKGQVYEMDLEYGRVVQEYNAGETVKEIRTLGQKNKYAERTAEQVILGASNNTVFSLDPRQSGQNKVKAQHQR